MEEEAEAAELEPHLRLALAGLRAAGCFPRFRKGPAFRPLFEAPAQQDLACRLESLERPDSEKPAIAPKEKTRVPRRATEPAFRR